MFQTWKKRRANPSGFETKVIVQHMTGITLTMHAGPVCLSCLQQHIAMHCRSHGMRVTQPRFPSSLLSKQTARLSVRSVHDLRSGVSTVKYLWQDGKWQDTRADQVPLLQRISAAVDVVELIETLVPVAVNHDEQQSSTHVLDIKVMSVYLSRLAEYKLSDPEAFDARAQGEQYSQVLNYVKEQLILACSLQSCPSEDGSHNLNTSDDSSQGTSQAVGLPVGSSTYVDIQPGEMSNILWALAVVGGGDQDTYDSDVNSSELQSNAVAVNNNLNTTEDYLINQQDCYIISSCRNRNVLQPNTGVQLVIALGDWAKQCLQQGCQELCDCKTQDLTSLLWAHACLYKQAGLSTSRAGHEDGQAKQSNSYDGGQLQQAMCSMLDGLCSEMATRLREVVSGSEMQPQDLADVSWSLAVTKHRSVASVQLIEAVAHEVYRQISNRHSLNEPFRTPDLIKILKSYAALDKSARTDASIPRMLDAIAGCVVKRIQRRDVNAITRPADIAQLLHAYADLEHTSVVIPEMISCTANQLRQELATLHTLHASDNQHNNDTSSSYLSFDVALSLLESYQRLNFYPGTAVVTAVLVPLTQTVQAMQHAGSPSSHSIPISKALRLLQVLSTFRYHPGPLFVDALVSHVHGEWQHRRATGLQLMEGVVAAALLGCNVDEHIAEDTCTAVLYLQPIDEEEEEDTACSNNINSEQQEQQQQQNMLVSATTSNEAKTAVQGSDHIRLKPLSATAACELLFALFVSNRMTIRRLGMACMAVRQDPKALNSLQGIHLVALSGAALLLGEEGHEMMEEVLPQELIGMTGAALSEYMHSWANSYKVHADSNAVAQDVASAAVNNLSDWTAQQCNEELQVLSCQWPLPIYRLRRKAISQSECEMVHAKDIFVSFDVIQTVDVAVNSPTSLLGTAILRKKLLEAVCSEHCLLTFGYTSLEQPHITQSQAEDENFSAAVFILVQLSVLYLRDLENETARKHVLQLLQQELGCFSGDKVCI